MLLGMFRVRDAIPPRALLPWSGEFAGKYLTACAEIHAVTGSRVLEAHIDRFVADLRTLQRPNGYLGPFGREYELTGRGPNIRGDYDPSQPATEGDTWDAWGHYHIGYGALAWYDRSSNPTALELAAAIGDLLCDRFLDTGRRLVDIGSTEMNMAPIHLLAALAERLSHPAHTSDGGPRTNGAATTNRAAENGRRPARYLRLAEQLVEELSDPSAGNYLEGALAGMEFYELPKPRWESLHAVEGLVTLHRVTGIERYRDAAEHLWWSIARLDRHNTGGFSSGEKAVGNPYHPGAIETCCTVAWTALSADVLAMTDNSVVADELELSLWNAGVGAHSPSGRWSTYDTPMDGHRWSSQKSISFQSRPGRPEGNCCSVNAPRLVGMVSRWAASASGDAVTVNLYAPCTIQGLSVAGTRISLIEKTGYPADGTVVLEVHCEAPIDFALRLRIPHWSEDTSIAVRNAAGKTVETAAPPPAQYHEIRRLWTPGDSVALTLDMALHYWIGERECAGRVSVYRGPVLFCLDSDYCDGRVDADPVLTAVDRRSTVTVVSGADLTQTGAAFGAPSPRVALDHPTANGRTIRLCDFASAGHYGNSYQSWLRIDHPPASAEFTPTNPLRSTRLG